MSTRHPGSRFAQHLDKICNLCDWRGRECCRFDSIRDDPSPLMSTRHPGSRFARHLDKICNLLNWEGRECCRFDLIRSIRVDSSALTSTGHPGSRFVGQLEKICKLYDRGVENVVDSRRFVCLDVDPSSRKSICATLIKNLQLVRLGGWRMLSIRVDSSALMSTRHPGCRFV